MGMLWSRTHKILLTLKLRAIPSTLSRCLILRNVSFKRVLGLFMHHLAPDSPLRYSHDLNSCVHSFLSHHG